MSEGLIYSNLEAQLSATFLELGISDDHKNSALELIKPLKEKDEIHRAHYEHSIRVGLLAKRIGALMNLDQKALFFAGIFHDLGKSEIDESLLGKTDPWTDEDYNKIREHPVTGFEKLKGKFDFSAEIIVRHHRFQENGYPLDLPPFNHDYSQGSEVLINEYARILALADVYDALHRENSKFGEKRKLTDNEIEAQMLAHNPDRKDLVHNLFRAGIFKNSDKLAQNNIQREIYENIWDEDNIRTPRETGRQVMLAASLEPIAGKEGNTTRYSNSSRYLKLEYFIAAGINLGESFELLAQRINDIGIQPEIIYDLAFKAQRDSLKNRAGGRVNQGIIELLIPIVASHHIYNSDGSISGEEVLRKANIVLASTSIGDIENLIKMKKLAYALSGYSDRVTPEYPEVKNVLEYYKKDLEFCEKPTSIAHNSEFVKGFPTVKLIYDSLSELNSDCFAERIEEAYRLALVNHNEKVGRGFIADCIAAGIYLYLSQNSKEKIII